MTRLRSWRDSSTSTFLSVVRTAAPAHRTAYTPCCGFRSCVAVRRAFLALPGHTHEFRAYKHEDRLYINPVSMGTQPHPSSPRRARTVTSTPAWALLRVPAWPARAGVRHGRIQRDNAAGPPELRTDGRRRLTGALEAAPANRSAASCLPVSVLPFPCCHNICVAEEFHLVCSSHCENASIDSITCPSSLRMCTSSLTGR